MTSRRTIALAVAACAVLAGCGTSTDSANTGSATSMPTVTATTSDAPTTSGTESATESPSETSTPGATSAAPEDTATPPGTTPVTHSDPEAPAGSVPQKSPEDYADAAVQAWTSGDVATLGKYVSPKARAAVSSAPAGGELIRAICEDDMCSYTSEDGKRVTLTMDLAKVKKGATGAITKVAVG